MYFALSIGTNQFCTLLLCAIFTLLLYKWYYRPPKFPPGPMGLPVIGVLPFIGKYPFKTFKTWMKSYGGMFSVRMGTDDWIILNEFEHVHQAFVKQSESFSGRPAIPLFHEFIQGRGIILLDDGPKFKSQRKFGLTTLRGFGVGKKSIEDKIIEEVHYLKEKIRSHENKPFEIKSTLSIAVSNIICNVVFGRRFDYDDAGFLKMLKSLSDNVVDDTPHNRMLAVLQLLYFLRFIPPFSSAKDKMRDSVTIVQGYLGAIIEQHQENFDENNINDFIDEFLRCMEKSEDPAFTEPQLDMYIRDLFIAGTETSASFLRWALLCFLHYPKTQKRIYQEVVGTCGSNGSVSYKDKSSMPYTNAFIQEIFRFRPLAPFGVPHKATKDTYLNGCLIPKGTQVLSNIYAIHHNDDLWKEPSRFDPSRHINEKGEFVPSNQIIPFGIGPRHCLGEQLAKMEVFIFLTALVQHFEFLPDPNASELPDLEKASIGFVYSPLDYNLVAKER